MRSLYIGVVYFLGPKTLWSDRVADEEVIARFESPWRWHAWLLTRIAFLGLDRMRCAWVLLKDGQVIEHREVHLPTT